MLTSIFRDQKYFPNKMRSEPLSYQLLAACKVILNSLHCSSLLNAECSYKEVSLCCPVKCEPAVIVLVRICSTEQTITATAMNGSLQTRLLIQIAHLLLLRQQGGWRWQIQYSTNQTKSVIILKTAKPDDHGATIALLAFSVSDESDRTVWYHASFCCPRFVSSFFFRELYRL